MFLFSIEFNKPEHVANLLDGQGEQNNEDDNEAGPEDDPEFESFGYMGNLNQKEEGSLSKRQFEDFSYKKICLPSNEELKHMTRKLVPEQMNVLRKVVAGCKDIVRARKNPSVKPKLFRILVHGGAGT